MTHPLGGRPAPSLQDLGWSPFFAGQLGPQDVDLAAMRIATVHRARLGAMSQTGPVRLTLQPHTNTGDFAVGDWVLVEPDTRLLRRRLDRRTVLERRTHDGRTFQLAAANADTLFIVSSCNADFNPARLERYLALANHAGITPVVLLTKADTADDPLSYRDQAAALQRDLPVITLDAKSDDTIAALAPWCTAGQTVALVGSSGVGKSTLVNTLAGSAQATPQLTGAVREHDAKGRHTTTSRSLHAIVGGGWVIDTPGTRSLNVGETGDGIDTLFAEITELAPSCRFRDCTHVHEPGCAVLAAVADGRLSSERLERWRKLQGESKPVAPDYSSPRSRR
jgi:ribosome biogenesis GTPase